ncbi:hypothetical protein G7Y89_g8540 [Cudoniella acicularis]|uniref:Protein kinase domain-containing protein n=1 Tax=Cudoniella acicularis TaxID=354080 RepID=A0A8H4W0I9_9HELO|nr:hypothetical protein G7Y89_g8540 [Cudoniella acicularis]
MREIKSIGHYMGYGSRAQVHAAFVGEERVALKIYRERAFFKQEREVYEHLLRSKQSPSLKLPRYFGPFVLTESVLSTFEFQPSRIDKRQHVGPCTPYRMALGFEEFSGVGLHTIINELKDTCLAKFEKDLFKTIRALHDVGICHRDLKADNILLDPTMLEDNQQVTMEYMVIDLSDAVLKHKTSEHCWRELQKLDLRNIREIFADARAAKAVSLGFQTLSNILLSNPNLNKDVVKQPAIDVETQLELSRLLKVAYSSSKIESLVDEILQTTTSLVPELCSAVVKILHNHARSSEALALLEKQFTNTITQNGRCPQLNRQKGLILQSLGSEIRDAAQAFELAITQFSEQLGPLDDATLCTRREYALFRAKIGDRNIATNILKDILETLVNQKVCTRKQARIIDTCSKEIKSLEAFKAADSSVFANDHQHLTPGSKRKVSSDTDSGIDLRSPKRLHWSSNREQLRQERNAFCED